MENHPTHQRVTTDDFFTGLLAALATSTHLSTIERRGEAFDQALAIAFEDFLKESKEKGLAVSFRIRTHPVHGDSTIVKEGLANAVRRDLISLDNPKYQRIRFKFSGTEGAELLSSVPGGASTYVHLAKRFLDAYDQINI